MTVVGSLPLLTHPARAQHEATCPDTATGTRAETCVSVSATACAVADWGGFGQTVPVLAGSAGAGASTFTAIALDVLQQAGRCALAIDAAEPARSGLAAAVAATGTEAIYPVAGLGVRYSWRGRSLLAQLEPTSPPHGQPPAARLAPLPVITPHQWLPPSGLHPLHVTVVDLGQQWSASTHTPLHGPAAWLRMGAPDAPGPWPVLVVRATRPSLMAAEAALARLDPWITAAQAVAPVRLVVMASWKRRGWPSGVTGAAGARVAALLDDAVFIPAERELDIGGVTEHPTPARAQAAVGELLHEWGLLTPTHSNRPRQRQDAREGRGARS
jgi:hypothetical protein